MPFLLVAEAPHLERRGQSDGFGEWPHRRPCRRQAHLSRGRLCWGACRDDVGARYESGLQVCGAIALNCVALGD
jgi:hypothetical protein